MSETKFHTHTKLHIWEAVSSIRKDNFTDSDIV